MADFWVLACIQEQGISVPNANRFQRRQQQQQEDQQPHSDPQAGPSTQPSSPSASGRSTPALREVPEVQDEDQHQEEDKVAATTGSKRKRASPATTAAQKRKAKKAAELDAELEELGGNDIPKGRYSDRKPGSFVFCAECGVKFTSTVYTRETPDGGVLCPNCQKEQDASNKEKGKPVKKPRGRAVKPKPQALEKPKPVVKSLQTCCIEVRNDI